MQWSLGLLGPAPPKASATRAAPSNRSLTSHLRSSGYSFPLWLGVSFTPLRTSHCGVGPPTHDAFPSFVPFVLFVPFVPSHSVTPSLQIGFSSGRVAVISDAAMALLLVHPGIWISIHTYWS